MITFWPDVGFFYAHKLSVTLMQKIQERDIVGVYTNYNTFVNFRNIFGEVGKNISAASPFSLFQF